MKLYEYTKAFEDALKQCTEAETGEITDFSAIEQLEIEFEEKVKNSALYYKGLMAEIQEFKEEEKKLEKRRKALEKEAEWFSNYIKRNIDKDYDFKTVRLSFKSSEETVITDKEAFEKYCKRHKELCTVEYKPNKSAIKQAIASGLKVKGAEVIKKQNLQIK